MPLIWTNHFHCISWNDLENKLIYQVLLPTDVFKVLCWRQKLVLCLVVLFCLKTKGLFTPNDSINVTVTVTFTGGTFDLFDGQCDRQNGLQPIFARQRNIFDGVVRCEQTLKLSLSSKISGLELSNYFFTYFW